VSGQRAIPSGPVCAASRRATSSGLAPYRAFRWYLEEAARLLAVVFVW